MPADALVIHLSTSATETDGASLIKAVYRHPNCTSWGEAASGSTDVALVMLDPTSSGVYMPALAANPVTMSNNHLTIYKNTTKSLKGQYVMSYGWGNYTNNGSTEVRDGNLHRAWKYVSGYESDGTRKGVFYGRTQNNEGTSCHGDSGGPDFWWDGTGMVIAGIHSTGNPRSGKVYCSGGDDGNAGPDMLRTWVENTAISLPMAGAGSNETPLWPAANATDFDPSTAYSSQYFVTAQNDRGLYLYAYLAKGRSWVNQLNLRARMWGGAVQAFPAAYNVYVTNDSNSSWINLGTYTAQPDSTGVVRLLLGGSFLTYGVLIVPITLGADSYGGHYFQLAELNLAYK